MKDTTEVVVNGTENAKIDAPEKQDLKDSTSPSADEIQELSAAADNDGTDSSSAATNATKDSALRKSNDTKPPSSQPATFQDNPIFKEYLPKEFCKVLQSWFKDGTIDQDEKEIFRKCADFLQTTTETDSSAKEWLSDQTDLIKITEQLLNEVSSYGYYIGIGGVEDTSLQSFESLIKAFETVECQQLLEPMFKCVTSPYYTDALRRLLSVTKPTTTASLRFLLITCPNYIISCDRDKSYHPKISQQMLSTYGDLLPKFLPTIQQWSPSVMLCLFYPLKFTLSIIHSLKYQERKPMYDFLLPILLYKAKQDENAGDVQEKLVYVALCILIDIVRCDTTLSNQLTHKTAEKSTLVKILSLLTKQHTNDLIQIKALELASLVVPEEEFRQENNTEQITAMFIKNLNTALAQGKPDRVDTVLRGFKDLIQNEDIKEELLKQNALPTIMKFAEERKDDPLPLEIVYAMTFNEDAKKLIQADQDFVEHVKALRQSEVKYVAKTAHGIVWKIEGEEKFRDRGKEKPKKVDEPVKEGEEKKDAPKEESSDPDAPKYDMMISYCWAQKEICHQINDRLEKDGFRVWLDRDEMRGSIIESMAEAIEQSRFVLIAMSSNYKKSINCKAEAEYAFNRKSKIIPLIVETDYKADGWLGFLAGSKIYVEFADKEGEEFDKAYDLLIEELKRNGLNDTASPPSDKPAEAGSTEAAPESKEDKSKKEEETKKEPEVPVIETHEYLSIPSALMWSEENVKEFLNDTKLDELKQVCDSMDGEALIEFHKTCERIPDVMIGLLNNPKQNLHVSMGTFFKFIGKLKKYIPPNPPRKVYFQYNFTQPSANASGTATPTINPQNTPPK